MTTPLELTFAVLAKSLNESANGVLLAALDWEKGVPHEAAISAALARRAKTVHSVVLEHWHALTPAEKEIVLQAQGRLSAALRDAVVSSDSQVFANACEIIEQTNEFDMVPTLVTVSEHLENPHAATAVALVVALAERLGAQLIQAEHQVPTRDPRFFRKTLLECLQRSIERYRYHKLDAIVEAYLLLCETSDSRLLNMLDDPHHPCFQTLSNVLVKSGHQRTIQLILELLQLEKPPATLYSVISHRADLQFIQQFFDFCATTDSANVHRNLKQLRALNWLTRREHQLSQLDEQLQQQAVCTLSLTNIAQDKLLSVLEGLLANGQTAGRAAACNALEKISGERTNRLIMRATNDPAVEVKAAAIRQLRMRHIPGTMPLLERMLDSPVPLLQEAARDALSEFTFQGYLKDYDLLHEEIRLATGGLVKKVDSEFLKELSAEFNSQVVKRRLRAIEIAQLLKVVPEVVKHLYQLAEDGDHFVRAAVAEALRFSPTAESYRVLEELTLDRSGTVQNAAQSSMAVIAERKANAVTVVEETN